MNGYVILLLVAAMLIAAAFAVRRFVMGLPPIREDDEPGGADGL